MLPPLLASLLALAPGAAAQAPPPVVNGTPTSDFAAVGALVAVEDGLGAVFCSATLIDPSWVVTAGHCQEAAVAYEDYGFEIVFAVGDDALATGGIEAYETVSRSAAHPDYTFDTYVDADIAVMKLEAAMTGVEPIALSSIGPDASAWPDDELIFVGWGITGDGREDAGAKRMAEMPLYTYDSVFLYSIDEGDQNLCSGDSGGATLYRDADGALVLAGVNSFVFSPDGGAPRCEGGGTGSTRVDTYLSWINAETSVQGQPTDDTTSSSGSAGGFYLDEDKSGCSAAPGAALGLWGLAGLALLGRRRR